MTGRADALKTAADALAQRLVDWRRALHRHPELGFEERWTAEFLTERLRELGLEPRTGIAETGIVALLRAPAGKGPAVLLRADMDALPVQEVAGRDYGSRVPGRMHACGHDGHMAMLLGAATLLAERREELARDVLLCFQPGEEGYGGAKRMIEEGVLEQAEIGSAFGLHLWSGFDHGTVHVRPGPMMAGNDEFTARIVGRGGHGALPHQTRDPIVAAAQAVTALQAIVSRSVDPVAPAVVTVGSFLAGSASNVIPEVAELRGTLRSFSEEVRLALRQRVREVLEGCCRAGGCELEFELHEGYPAVINDPAAVETARKAARDVVGATNVHENPPLAAAEDFSYFLQKLPGAFLFLGARNVERGIAAPHHSAEFDIEEAVLPRGAELLARLALS